MDREPNHYDQDCRPSMLITPSAVSALRFAHIDRRKPLVVIVGQVFHDGLVHLTVFDSKGKRPALRTGFNAQTLLFLRSRCSSRSRTPANARNQSRPMIDKP